MDWPKQVGAASVSLALAVSTVGCSTPQPTTPPFTPSEATSESDDAALVAAIEAYTRYSAAFDAYLAQPVADSDLGPLRATVTEGYAEVLEREFAEDPRTWVQEGSSSFHSVELLHNDDGESHAVSIGLCVDTSHLSLRDARGGVITSDRQVRFPMRVALEGQTLDELRVAGAESVSEGEACER